MIKNVLLERGININSHIQLPKAILKQFKEKTGRVFYLNLDCNEIGLAGVSVLGTERDYYSEEIEKLLSKEIEKPISDLAHKVTDFFESEDRQLVLTLEEEQILKDYMSYSVIRSKLMQAIGERRSNIIPMLSYQQKHDVLVYFFKKIKPEIPYASRDSSLSVLYNCTDVSFVVPQNCFYTIKSSGMFCTIAPISPKIVLALLPNGYTGNIVNGEELHLGKISSAKDIMNFNIAALTVEYVMNKGFVASVNSMVLRELQQYIDEHRSELDALRKDVIDNLHIQ